MSREVRWSDLFGIDPEFTSETTTGNLRAERDRARATAVALEAECARLTDALKQTDRT